MYSKKTKDGQECMQPRKMARGARVFFERPRMPRPGKSGPCMGALMQQAGGGEQ